MESPELFGFLICDKPAGMTSRDVVNVIQRRVRPIKVGHAGTLDPLAEGVLVIGVGPAVRLVPYVQQQPKHYLGVFQLGQSSPSLDLEDGVQHHPELPTPSRDQIEAAASQLVGDIEQIPPAYSAVWVNGQRAYKLARAGESVEMPARRVRVNSLVVNGYEFPELNLDIICGSGTYIRTLGNDLAKKVGSLAVMSHLRRVGIGPFQQAESVSIEQLRKDEIASLLVSPTLAVQHLPSLRVDAGQSTKLGHGLGLDDPVPVPIEESEGQDSALAGEVEAAAITDDGQLRAILRPKRGRWCPYRVFPVSDGDSAKS